MTLSATPAHIYPNDYYTLPPLPPLPPLPSCLPGGCIRLPKGKIRREDLIKEDLSSLKPCLQKIHDHYNTIDGSSFRWNASSSRRTFFIFSFDGFSSSRSRNAPFAALIASVGSLVAAFFAGKEIGHLKNIKDALSCVDSLLHEALLPKERDVINATQVTLQALQKTSQESLALKVALTVSLVIGSVGAAVGSLFMGLGFGVAFAVGCILFAREGAYQALKCDEEIKKRLREHKEDVNILIEPSTIKRMVSNVFEYGRSWT